MYLFAQLIGAIFHKSLRLSGRARQTHTVGKVTTMISADTSRLDMACRVAHKFVFICKAQEIVLTPSAYSLWSSALQIIIAVALLIWVLGYSALVGLAVLVLGFPAQAFFVRIMLRQRQKSVNFTDKRVRYLTEVIIPLSLHTSHVKARTIGATRCSLNQDVCVGIFLRSPARDDTRARG